MIFKEVLQNLNLETVIGPLPKHDLEIGFDTRKLIPGHAFYAIRGEVHDAFNFIESHIVETIPLVFFENTKESLEKAKALSQSSPSTCFAAVSNSSNFLRTLGRKNLEHWKTLENRVVIGITGSNGKTTTKEFLYHLLNGLYPDRVHKTEGNLNNLFGLPMTLLRLNRDHLFSILELGINQKNEMDELLKIVSLDVGLITMIGEAHIEFLESKEGIYFEKTKLFNNVVENNGLIVVNADDEYLKNYNKGNRVLVGRNSSCKSNFYHDHLEGSFQGKEFNIKSSVRGEHNYQNLGLCLQLCFAILPQRFDELIELAQCVSPSKNRGEYILCKDTLVYLDAYNANPSSMKLSLKSFAETMKEKALQKSDCLIVCGDMLEIGRESSTYHQEIGQLISLLGFEKAIFIGKMANFYAQGFQGQSDCYSSVSEAKPDFIKRFSQQRAIFLKGSRSVGLENLID